MLGAPIRKEEEEAPPDLEKSRGSMFPLPSCVERNKKYIGNDASTPPILCIGAFRRIPHIKLRRRRCPDPREFQVLIETARGGGSVRAYVNVC